MSSARDDVAAGPVTRPPNGSGEMFDAIARRYDLVNRVLSLGIDQYWRSRASKALELGPGAVVLDHATGTADLAIRIAKAHPSAKVVGVDPSREMLAIAERKVRAHGLEGRIALSFGDATKLSFRDGEFDGVSMAFGIRNVSDRKRALSEMARVTRSGGRVVILELTDPESGGFLGPLCRFHVHRLVPRIGALLSGAPAYRYLHESIARFPPPAEFAELMERASLRVLAIKPLTFGVCHLYVAEPNNAG